MKAIKQAVHSWLSLDKVIQRIAEIRLTQSWQHFRAVGIDNILEDQQGQLDELRDQNAALLCTLQSVEMQIRNATHDNRELVGQIDVLAKQIEILANTADNHTEFLSRVREQHLIRS